MYLLYKEEITTTTTTDLEHGLKSVVTSIVYRISKTRLVSFFVHRRKSRNRFRIFNSLQYYMYYCLDFTIQFATILNGLLFVVYYTIN